MASHRIKVAGLVLRPGHGARDKNKNLGRPRPAGRAEGELKWARSTQFSRRCCRQRGSSTPSPPGSASGCPGSIIAAVLVSAINATVRKVFDTSSNSWLELQWVLFSIVFLLCSPWTLLANEHIRIDIVNNMLPKRDPQHHRCDRSRIFSAAADDRDDPDRRSLLPGFVRSKRAVVECRRPAAMAVEGPDHDRVRDACSSRGFPNS